MEKNMCEPGFIDRIVLHYSLRDSWRLGTDAVQTGNLSPWWGIDVIPSVERERLDHCKWRYSFLSSTGRKGQLRQTFIP